MCLAQNGERRVRSCRAGADTDVPWDKHVEVSMRRVAIYLCCGLCVFCVARVGLWLYPTEWLQAAVRPNTPPPVIVEPSKTPPPKQEAPIVDLNSYLLDRDVFYRRLPAGYVQNKRIEDQAKLLETYKKDPEGFL